MVTNLSLLSSVTLKSTTLDAYICNNLEIYYFLQAREGGKREQEEDRHTIYACNQYTSLKSEFSQSITRTLSLDVKNLSNKV